MTTLLEKMAEIVASSMRSGDGNPPEGHAYDARLAVVNALTAIATPTLAQANRGGLKAFSGPQPEGGPPMIYPAAIWRAMLEFIINEDDRARADDDGDDAESDPGAPEGGPEPDLLQGHPDHGGGEPAEGPVPGVQGREDGAEG